MPNPQNPTSTLQSSTLKCDEKFESVFNNLADAVFIHDLQGHFLEVNQTAADRLGYSREELLQMRPQDIDDVESAEKVAARMKEMQEKGQITFETVHISKDATKIPSELNSKVIQYLGKPAVLTVARDITERKKDEKVLEEINQKLVDRELKMIELKKEIASLKQQLSQP